MAKPKKTSSECLELRYPNRLRKVREAAIQIQRN